MALFNCIIPAKLPEALRYRHDKAPSVTATTRAAIASHSEIVERAVRTSIAGRIALPRTELLGKIHSALEEHRIICVSGAAGSGKSCLAKVVFDTLKPQGLAVAFRAESFAEPHLNDVFALHKFTAEDLSALAALHSRKWIWIESVERLLEKSERHAFLDLLYLVAKDPSLRLILTCRDYHVESVRSATFGAAGLEFVHVPVPLLTDGELAEVAQQMPVLAAPLAEQRLRELLRNLFFLEKAATLNWSAGTVLPRSKQTRDGPREGRVLCPPPDRPCAGSGPRRAELRRCGSWEKSGQGKEANRRGQGERRCGTGKPELVKDFKPAAFRPQY